MEPRKTASEIKFPFGALLSTVVSFGMAILDMFFLRDAIQNLAGGPDSNDVVMPSIVALLVATMANVFAYMAGYANGKNIHKHKRFINKDSFFPFLFWMLIGFGYIVIRVANILIMKDEEGFSWQWEAIQMVILAVSYISTGYFISKSAKDIHDIDVVRCRMAKKEMNNLRKKVNHLSAIVQNNLGILSLYGDNYKNLDLQYAKIHSAIYHAEDTAMSDIVGKTVAKNPSINPVKAHEVKNRVIKSREEKHEKLHA